MTADDFEPATENALLREAILRRIDETGGLTFREFMELALYHPDHGYYRTREPMGRRGDYVTSPETHPLFGALVGRQLREMWETMGRPARFDIVEYGPGTGLLARDLLHWAANAAPQFGEAVRYTLIETSDSLIERQRRTLAGLGLHEGALSWADAAPDVIEGCVLSNEFLDALPVHRVTVLDGRLYEVYVVRKDSGFAEALRPPSTPEIEAYFDRLGLRPGEGCEAEVNLGAVAWMRDVARRLARGFVLTFDYGYPADELYAPWRKQGTLLCFYRHNASHDPYARIGRQDITASVDFTTLIRVGEEEGLTTLGFTTQARFLTALGIGEALERALRQDPAELEEYYARRRAVTELLDPAGLGRIRVLAQGRGVGSPRLTGFADP
ncbi:MAG TPA: SAM-dependent methyltransferase [Dehalococcoidia bacterium]|nr:SAM-dependent methyltransferase [Dehalococcoidia bacterium]